jgi:hypothetical protein
VSAKIAKGKSLVGKQSTNSLTAQILLRVHLVSVKFMVLILSYQYLGYRIPMSSTENLVLSMAHHSALSVGPGKMPI